MAGVDTKTDLSRMVADCGLHVTKRGAVKRRQAVVFTGLATRFEFGLHNNSLINGIRALVERVFRSPLGGQLQPPPPCSANVSERLKAFYCRLVRRVGVHRPITRQQFVDMYSGRRRAVYERAVQSVEARAVSGRDFAVRNAFVKAEKINFTAKPDPAPRVIQPRDPRYNVEVGVYLKVLEHAIYKAIELVFGGPTVMKGYSAEGVARELRAMWDKFRDPVAIGLDASRFDQHVRIEMLRWEHSVYTAAYQGVDRERLSWLLRGQLVNRGVLRADDGSVKYVVHGSRMSGDMNTALGNCLIMCALVYTMLAERGVEGRLANNGDDCVLVVERTDLDKVVRGLEEWFLEFGFRMKVETPVDVFERIEFCQAHPVWDGNKWVMVRNPHVALSKDPFCVVRDYGYGQAARKWLYAVGECGLAMSGGIPVMQEYYSAFLRNGAPGLGTNAVIAETGMAHLARGMHRTYGEVTDEARVSFWLAFGVSPSHQRALEEKLASVSIPIPSSPCIGPNGALGLLTL